MESGLGAHIDMPVPIARELKGKKRGRNNTADNGSMIKGPVVHPRSTSDKEVKRCTGFVSMTALLAYIAVVCNENFDQMKQSSSEMTWFEEWFMYFEIVWGRSSARWIDVKAKYGLSRGVIT